MDFEPLRRALAHIAADERVWRRVCLPVYDDPMLPVGDLPPDVVAGLVEGGVVSVERGLLRRRRWVTQQFGRPYLLSLHEFAKPRGFIQDIWPETLALLERIRAAPPGRLADVGTGCGVLAIEAALAGHTVVATDIDEGALATAAWNAELHGVTLDLRPGHLAVPLGDETFDLIVCNPHYGGPGDMLRIEVLRECLSRLTPGGTLAVGAPLEWDSDGVGVVEGLLRPRGARVKLTPITPKTKTRWFTSPVPPGPGLVERGRFLIEVGREGPIEIAFPPHEPEAFIPLARLHGGRARRAEVRTTLDARTTGAWNRRPAATVLTTDDVTALEELLGDCARGALDLDAPVPFDLHDGCRWGARPCLKAHRAIVDARGGVRPCTHAPAVGTVEDSAPGYRDRMRALQAELEERRGCARCPAEKVCSKCTFPVVVDEATYCDLVRRHAAALPVLHRILGLLTDQHAESIGKDHLRLRFAVAEDGDPTPPLPELRHRLHGAVLAVCDGESRLDAPGSAEPFPLTPETALVIERVMAGGGREESGLAPQDVEALLYFLTQWLR